jgi:hypothetical protein
MDRLEVKHEGERGEVRIRLWNDEKEGKKESAKLVAFCSPANMSRLTEDWKIRLLAPQQSSIAVEVEEKTISIVVECLHVVSASDVGMSKSSRGWTLSPGRASTKRWQGRLGRA